MHTLRVDYPDDLLATTGKSTAELEDELALLLGVKLFELRRLSLGKAAELARRSKTSFSLSWGGSASQPSTSTRIKSPTSCGVTDQELIADSSPSIALAVIDALDLLPRIYRRILIPRAVWHEETVAGFGQPGADAVRGATWL